MGEHISREAALEVVERYFTEILELNPDICLDGIKSIPDADVVEVVRCRECKYRAEDDFCMGRGWPNQLVAGDGFCEKGKRKDGGQDDGD